MDFPCFLLVAVLVYFCSALADAQVCSLTIAMNMPSPLPNTCVLLGVKNQTAPATRLSQLCEAAWLRRRRLRVPLRHEPEQTGTSDVVVLKELRPFLFRVPVLFALFGRRL